jgi:hypothetical protein
MKVDDARSSHPDRPVGHVKEPPSISLWLISIFCHTMSLRTV